MKSKEYRAVLSRLPIKNPTPRDMAMLCPHLTEKEAVKAFKTGSGLVACPSLRIKYGFQVVSYKEEWVEEIKVWRGNTQVTTGKKNHPATLRNDYANRTLRSYSDHKKHGDVISRYPAMNKAMRYAENNWGSELILDSWASVLELYIQDPTDLVNDKYHQGSPRTKTVLYIALNRDLNEIHNDHSKPESVLIDEAIIEMTVDPVLWNEIKGGRGGYIHFNCAHCGGGLELTSCISCKHTYQDDGWRSSNDTPLSCKMVAFLRENGHEFKIDPEIAREKETQARVQHGKL